MFCFKILTFVVEGKISPHLSVIQELKPRKYLCEESVIRVNLLVIFHFRFNHAL